MRQVDHPSLLDHWGDKGPNHRSRRSPTVCRTVSPSAKEKRGVRPGYRGRPPASPSSAPVLQEVAGLARTTSNQAPSSRFKIILLPHCSRAQPLNAAKERHTGSRLSQCNNPRPLHSNSLRKHAFATREFRSPCRVWSSASSGL